MIKKKFIIELDEAPALLLIQKKTGWNAEIYQDGEKLKGVRSATIRAAVGEATTHEIEFITGLTEEKESHKG